MALSISIFVKWELIINEPIAVWILVWWTLVDVISEKVEFHLSITIQSPYSPHPFYGMFCEVLKIWKRIIFRFDFGRMASGSIRAAPVIWLEFSSPLGNNERRGKIIWKLWTLQTERGIISWNFRCRKSELYFQVACVVKSASSMCHWPLSSKRR